MMAVLWCVTGGEWMLEECVSLMESLDDVTVAFSGAGGEVGRMYGLHGRITDAAETVVEGRMACSPIVMKLRGYDRVVVAPCTANTVAKIVHGVADSLVTNIVSQALKMGVDVVVLPTDAAEKVKGRTVDGREFELACRKVDLDNVKKLAAEVKVAYTVDELAGLLM